LISFIRTTPLRLLEKCSKHFGCEVYGKLEIYNPTGSHKDRESEEILRYAERKNIWRLGIASTGNAAISLAAYTYINALKCYIFLPKTIAAERLAQIRAFNPTINFSDTYDEAIAQCNENAERVGFLNCNPGVRVEKIIGDSKIGTEIAKQDWTHVVVPTNNGTLLVGIWKGLRKADARTRMVAAVAKQTKLAEGIAGFHRNEEPALSKAVKDSKGAVVEVLDREISKAAQLLASDGLIVEGAAAAAIAALERLKHKSKVCCLITGSGLKFPSCVRELLSTQPT
jgi:threonine synthase